MVVSVNGHLYEMSKKEANGILSIAKSKVSKGIYAVKKDNYLELKNDCIEDKEKLKKEIAKYNQQGFLVYFK